MTNQTECTKGTLALPPVALKTLLGGLSVREFLAEYWQKKPLLVRQAVPGFQGLVSRDELFALARDADVESRLVRCQNGQWSVQHGPQQKKSLQVRNAPVPWTVLVQGLNLWRDNADRLLRYFSFIPYARLDDLMVSYAVNGGGVGPHFDDYDVFLLQGIGRRRWQIANQSDRTVLKDAPLKILKDFRPVHDWVLETGDLLYLPPHWAHNGIAIGECMTYSVGFRSPSFDELGREFLYWMAERQSLPGIYADPGLKVQKRPARIDEAMVGKIAQVLANIRWQRSDVAAFLGEYLSEPKPQIFFEPPENPPAPEDFARQVAAHGVRLHRKCLMLWTPAAIYLNGEELDCDALSGTERELLTRFADTRVLPPTACSPALLELLYGMLTDGFLAESDEDSAEQ